LYSRAYAVEVLGKLGDKRAFDILLRTLESEEDSWVRSMAAEGLGWLGDRRAIPALVWAAEDASWHVNQSAKESLARLEQN
jgi:HEAT repeat protein